MWKAKWKNQTKSLLSKVGKIQKSQVKGGDHKRHTQGGTHAWDKMGLARRKMSTNKIGPNEDY
jgi:hypothetical protein